MRRRAHRLRAKDGAHFVMPESIATWEAAFRADPSLAGDAKFVMERLAHLLRRAAIVHNALPGDEVWVRYDDLGRTA